MSIETPIREQRGTFDEVVARLGDVPLTRIWKNPPPGTATEDDVLRADNEFNRLCELVDGVLVEKPIGYMESRLAVLISHALQDYMDEMDLGLVAGEAGMLQLSPGLVRIPDVSVVLWESLPGGELPAGPIPAVAPDIAIEILSKSNTAGEMRRKVGEYFHAGSRLVILVDGRSRTVRHFASPTSYVTLKDSDLLTLEPVLPGFSVTLAPLFDMAARRARK